MDKKILDQMVSELHKKIEEVSGFIIEKDFKEAPLSIDVGSTNGVATNPRVSFYPNKGVNEAEEFIKSHIADLGIPKISTLLSAPGRIFVEYYKASTPSGGSIFLVMGYTCENRHEELELRLRVDKLEEELNGHQ